MLCKIHSKLSVTIRYITIHISNIYNSIRVRPIPINHSFDCSCSPVSNCDYIIIIYEIYILFVSIVFVCFFVLLLLLVALILNIYIYYIFIHQQINQPDWSCQSSYACLNDISHACVVHTRLNCSTAEGSLNQLQFTWLSNTFSLWRCK